MLKMAKLWQEAWTMPVKLQEATTRTVLHSKYLKHIYIASYKKTTWIQDTSGKDQHRITILSLFKGKTGTRMHDVSMDVVHNLSGHISS